MSKNYACHVRRTWVDTHSQSIRTDPEIYLPGEVAAEEEDDNPTDDSDEEDDEEEGKLAGVTSGVKRKAGSKHRSGFIWKVAKTTAQGSPSTAARDAIDDRRPDYTLFDAPVGESTLAHPYGRHGCLYIKVKVAVDEKPNPQGAVSRLFL